MEISFDFSNNANYSLEQNYSKLLMKYTLLKQKLENIPPYKPSKSSAKKIGQYTMDDKLV